MNKTIFSLEGVDCLQVARLSGLIEMYELEDDKVEVETKQELVLLKGRFKINKDILMIAKEVRKPKQRGTE